MNRKLPEIFVNRISDVKNNERVSYGFKEVRKNEENLSVIQKINKMFSLPGIINGYKVNIKTERINTIKEIIGRNKYSLITIENEIIPIADIIDIEMKE